MSSPQQLNVMLLKIFDQMLPWAKLPLLLLLEMVVGISGAQADCSPFELKNFYSCMADHVNTAHQPNGPRDKTTKMWARVEVSTVWHLDIRLAEYNMLSMCEIFRSITKTTGDKHQLITQVDHKATQTKIGMGHVSDEGCGCCENDDENVAPLCVKLLQQGLGTLLGWSERTLAKHVCQRSQWTVGLHP